MIRRAVFGGGCFWGVEEKFRTLPGVISTEVGYMGGSFANPRYEDVCTGLTGHAEVVAVTYDSDLVSYEKLLEHFFRIHDPTTPYRQGPDIGNQYRSVIFFSTHEEEAAANKLRDVLEHSGRYKRAFVTEIKSASTFWPAEEYHQHYLQRHRNSGCHISRE